MIDKNGRHALAMASTIGNTDGVTVLLETQECDIDAKFFPGFAEGLRITALEALRRMVILSLLANFLMLVAMSTTVHSR